MLEKLIDSCKKAIFTGLILLSSTCFAQKPLDGVCLSPFRQGQSPETGVFPTTEQINEDVFLCNKIAGKVRTYGVDPQLEKIVDFCYDYGLDCYVGSWFNQGDSSGDQATVNTLIRIANKDYDTTKAVIVGNEFLLNNGGLESRLLGLISNVKQGTSVPVSAGETWSTWRDHPNLANAVDFLGIHVHPYWENISIDNAAQYVVDRYNQIKTQYPGKKVVVLETGWPQHGNTLGAAVPSAENQRKFIADFTTLAKQNNIEYTLFEAFDEPWKLKYNPCEDSWGVFYEDRTLKPHLSDVIRYNLSDINNDGKQDYFDLKDLSDDWLNTTEVNTAYSLGDINRDRITNFKDFSYLAESWRK